MANRSRRGTPSTHSRTPRADAYSGVEFVDATKLAGDAVLAAVDGA
jgi:hypothetical protein